MLEKKYIAVLASAQQKTYRPKKDYIMSDYLLSDNGKKIGHLYLMLIEFRGVIQS